MGFVIESSGCCKGGHRTHDGVDEVRKYRMRQYCENGRNENMKFVYPAIIKETSDGFYGYFPDLDMCEATGSTLMQLEEHLKDACMDWITLELDEGGSLPEWSTEDDLKLKEDERYQYIAVNIRFMPGYDE